MGRLVGLVLLVSLESLSPVAIMVIREFLLSSSCSLEETVPHMILASVPTIS